MLMNVCVIFEHRQDEIFVRNFALFLRANMLGIHSSFGRSWTTYAFSTFTVAAKE